MGRKNRTMMTLHDDDDEVERRESASFGENSHRLLAHRQRLYLTCSSSHLTSLQAFKKFTNSSEVLNLRNLIELNYFSFHPLDGSHSECLIIITMVTNE